MSILSLVNIILALAFYPIVYYQLLPKRTLLVELIPLL